MSLFLSLRCALKEVSIHCAVDGIKENRKNVENQMKTNEKLALFCLPGILVCVSHTANTTNKLIIIGIRLASILEEPVEVKF